ncbi:HdeD family acid-resistance protein [Saccharothrix sp. ST-888]|uniref:HdeD family acid-resistance protein n=1 Tax=Saccharothrix sp. ST-888 TaxID=1427391 RepID=UPI0009E457B1|nr:HdeD family acid-resistance protein [Saccharothrix sp. ST-888]
MSSSSEIPSGADPRDNRPQGAGEPSRAGAAQGTGTAAGTGPLEGHGIDPYGGALGALANATWQVLLTAGVAAVALGVFVLVWPGATLFVVGVLFGIYLLISGVFQLTAAFGHHVPGHLRALHFVSGALFLLLGLICFRGAAETILLLALWIGFGWLLRGVMLTTVAISSPALPARGWQVFLGVITAIAGVVLIVSPFRSIAALTLVAGIWLIVLGLIEIVHAIQLRSRIRKLGSGAAAANGTRGRPHPHPQT